MPVQLDKISTISRGKEKKKHGTMSGIRYPTSVKPRNIEDTDGQQMVQFQQTINRMPEGELNMKFDQMLVGVCI